jgi:hypothetical protein
MNTDEEIGDLFGEEYNLIQQLKGWALCERMSEAVIEIPDLRGRVPPFSGFTEAQAKNPILKLLAAESYIPSASLYYRDLAAIFLGQLRFHRQQMERQNVEDAGGPITFLDGSSIPSDDELIPLTRFITHNTHLPRVEELPDWLFVDPDIEQICWWYFFQCQTVFDEALDRACRCVQQGIPLYERAEQDTFTQVPLDDPDCIYLSKKAEYLETGGMATERPGMFPKWAERYFVKWGHLQERERFFGSWKQYHSDDAMKVLRGALRRSIGISDADHLDPSAESTQRKFNTSLYGLAERILTGRCPGFLELKSDEEQWPKQELVVRWLQKPDTFGLSEAEAKAIDAVTRPDALRARGKRSKHFRRD